MSLKEKITSLLFNSKQKEEQEEDREEQGLAAQAVPEEAEKNETVDQTLLELPSDHPLNRLYDRRRREKGYLPAPRLCLDENGELPPELVQKEKIRLRTVLTSVCSARFKAASKGEGRTRKKKDGEEQEDGPPVLDAQPCFFLSADKLCAWMIVLPPVGEGQELSREMVQQGMAEQGILYGVDKRTADRLYRDEKRYFNLVLIARGKPAFDGKNGNIVEYFPRVLERMLEVDEYDQVDYTALNLIRNVKKGQEICRLILPTEGEPGRTVLDQEIPAKSGKAVPLPAGRNTEISEDGVSLLASIAGHVEFTGHSFQVKPVLDIDGNVDFSTGSINFLGDINVKGDVLSGFTVRAMGNIQVGGVIEAGSSVEAGGDLAVVKGILGDGSTVVRSHRSIFAKYIENATIYAQENLQTDCIINGRVYCDGEVQVRSGRGSIMGGRIWAAKKINAKTVGSASECRTAVVLGGLPCANFEREIVRQKLKNLEMELEKLECQPDSPVKTNLLSKIRVKISTSELKLKQLDEELMDLEADGDEENEGRLECSLAYAGTEINFGDETLRLRRESRQCVAKLVDGEIIMM